MTTGVQATDPGGITGMADEDDNSWCTELAARLGR